MPLPLQVLKAVFISLRRCIKTCRNSFHSSSFWDIRTELPTFLVIKKIRSMPKKTRLKVNW